LVRTTLEILGQFDHSLGDITMILSAIAIGFRTQTAAILFLQLVYIIQGDRKHVCCSIQQLGLILHSNNLTC